MLYENLTIKEAFANTSKPLIKKIFLEGLKDNCELLALAAMEELISRGEIRSILKMINQAFKEAYLRPKSMMSNKIARLISKNCGMLYSIFYYKGEEIFESETDNPIKDTFGELEYKKLKNFLHNEVDIPKKRKHIW